MIHGFCQILFQPTNKLDVSKLRRAKRKLSKSSTWTLENSLTATIQTPQSSGAYGSLLAKDSSISLYGTTPLVGLIRTQIRTTTNTDLLTNAQTEWD